MDPVQSQALELRKAEKSMALKFLNALRNDLSREYIADCGASSSL